MLKAGDNILVAQELLKNSLETLVNYAGEDYAIKFKNHLLIADTLSDVVTRLDSFIKDNEQCFTPDKLNLTNN